MDPIEEFKQRVAKNTANMAEDQTFKDLTQQWLIQSIQHEYTFGFTWLDRPIIQVPQDIYAIQEVIWSVKPDLIIETGIAHGGSLIMSASMLAMIDYCEAAKTGQSITPGKSHRKVIGLDIDIRDHNRKALEAHPLFSLIHMIEGSSVDPNIVETVTNEAKQAKTVLVFLDSNHTHDHVLDELRAYGPLVSPDSYCVVWDSGVEDLPDGFVTNRPWGKGNNPMTAVFAYMKELEAGTICGQDGTVLAFDIDKSLETRIGITASPNGFLRRKPSDS